MGAVGEAPASEASAGGEDVAGGSFDQVGPVIDIVNILTSQTIQVLPGDIIADVQLESVADA